MLRCAARSLPLSMPATHTDTGRRRTTWHRATPSSRAKRAKKDSVSCEPQSGSGSMSTSVAANCRFCHVNRSRKKSWSRCAWRRCLMASLNSRTTVEMSSRSGTRRGELKGSVECASLRRF